LLAIRQWFYNFVERKTAQFFYWALSKHMVQKAVVDIFTTRGTPMCRALEEAAESAVEDAQRNWSVNTDDIDDFEREVEDMIENHLKDALRDVNRDLERLTDEVISAVTTHEKLVEVAATKAVEIIMRRLRNDEH
jgi:hypothetical protein